MARSAEPRQKVADLELDEVEDLGIVDEIDLVQKDDDRGDVDLPGQQDVLPRLRHGAVVRGHDQDRTVHLRGPRDHVLDVVRVSGAVDVSVVPFRRFVLDVGDVDRDAPLPFLGGVVDLIVGPELVRLVGPRQHARDGRRQGRLAMVHMADRPDVDVRLRSFELPLGHLSHTSDA
jgi:hypothetical protein